MQRTTKPTSPGIVPLTEHEFEELLAAEGTELVAIDPEVIMQANEPVNGGNGNGENDICNMIFDAPMRKAMESCGITKQFLAGLLLEAMKATKTIVFLDQKSGSILYSKDLINWKVREDARRDAHKLLAHYPPERQELSGPNGTPISLKTGPAVQAIIREIEVTVLGGEGSNAPLDGN